MNLNEALIRLSSCSDTELLSIIRTGIARYSSSRVIEERVELTNRRVRNQRCASVTLFSKHSGKTVYEIEPSEIMTNYETEQNLFEINNLIESVFKRFLAKFKDTAWVKPDKNEAHIAIVKQLFLDCYVADLSYFELLCGTAGSKIWIDFVVFKKMIVNTRGTSPFNIFSVKRYDKKIQKNFMIQKMIFFFSFGQFEFGKFITRNNLVKILTLVNIKEKTQLNIWADHLITGANKMMGSGKDYVGFSEFMKFIIS